MKTYSRKKGNLLDSNKENIFRNKKTESASKGGKKMLENLKKKKKQIQGIKTGI